MTNWTRSSEKVVAEAERLMHIMRSSPGYRPTVRDIRVADTIDGMLICDGDARRCYRDR
jgi:hypothetical protein